MAAGIHDDSGKMIAGLSISAPADRLQEDWKNNLMETAHQISAALGYKGHAEQCQISIKEQQ
jgi:DNA-binding IclR family transcriptional regulator